MAKTKGRSEFFSEVAVVGLGALYCMLPLRCLLPSRWKSQVGSCVYESRVQSSVLVEAYIRERESSIVFKAMKLDAIT